MKQKEKKTSNNNGLLSFPYFRCKHDSVVSSNSFVHEFVTFWNPKLIRIQIRIERCREIINCWNYFGIFLKNRNKTI